jgi:hypothetical protein
MDGSGVGSQSGSGVNFNSENRNRLRTVAEPGSDLCNPVLIIKYVENRHQQTGQQKLPNCYSDFNESSRF